MLARPSLPNPLGPVARNAGERGTAVQAEGLTQQGHALLVWTDRIPRLADEDAKPMQIDLFGREVEDVAASRTGYAVGGLAAVGGRLSQQSPDPGDVGGQRVAGPGGRSLAPDPVHDRL